MNRSVLARAGTWLLDGQADMSVYKDYRERRLEYIPAKRIVIKNKSSEWLDVYKRQHHVRCCNGKESRNCPDD